MKEPKSDNASFDVHQTDPAQLKKEIKDAFDKSTGKPKAIYKQISNKLVRRSTR